MKGNKRKLTQKLSKSSSHSHPAWAHIKTLFPRFKLISSCWNSHNSLACYECLTNSQFQASLHVKWIWFLANLNISIFFHHFFAIRFISFASVHLVSMFFWKFVYVKIPFFVVRSLIFIHILIWFGFWISGFYHNKTQSCSPEIKIYSNQICIHKYSLLFYYFHELLEMLNRILKLLFPFSSKIPLFVLLVKSFVSTLFTCQEKNLCSQNIFSTFPYFSYFLR